MLCTASAIAFAQPQPCVGDPQMASTCFDACVICDIDGFKGRNSFTGQGQAFSEFCTTYAHNMNYIAFIAGTTNLTIDVSVSNCNQNRGLEIGLWESSDCQTFSKVSKCDTDVRPNTTVSFENTVPLVIGQHYYLIMDGSSGDVCDWTFNVVEGSTAVGQLTTSGIITGQNTTCPGLVTTYSTTGDIGANIFFWSVNGVSQSSLTNEIDIVFPQDGTYEVCVTATNVCDEAPPSCYTVEVITPKTLYINEVLCDNNCLEVADTLLCTTGNYDFTISLPNGCDSLIFVDLIVLPQAKSSIDINLCVGEAFLIGNNPYTTTGVYIDTVLTSEACDSIVTLDLFMIECEIKGTTDYIAPICNGDPNGVLLFSVDNGTPPFTYTWEHITDNSIGGVGNTDLLIGNRIENVPSGKYEINVMDDFGNDVVFFQEVIDPDVLKVVTSPVDIGPYNLTCNGGNDGTATAIAFGGVPPYQFVWSNGVTGQVITNISAGDYIVNVTDGNGCIRSTDIVLTEPLPLEIDVSYINPNCDGFETGEVKVNTIKGGSPGYTNSLDGISFTQDSLYRNLSAGEYTVTIRDANGCTKDTTAAIFAPDIPILNMGDDLEVDLGCDILLPVTTNVTNLEIIRWIDSNNTLDCDTCLQPIATPYNETKYLLQVTSVDGCSTEDSITISVKKTRDIFFPNIFSPNRDGVNDRFTVAATKSVASIRSMKIFDRWGNVVYAAVDLIPNDYESSWDGRYKDEILNTGIYVWVAEVEYLDGETLYFSGDITLVK